MKKFLLLTALILGFSILIPAESQARVFVGVNVGGGYGYGGGYGPGYHHHYHGYYPGFYDGYYPGYYVAPPPVVYAPPPVYYAPPVAPPVVYQQTPVYQTAPGYAVPNSVVADQASETYTDDQGQTCREYQTTAKIAGNHAPAYGTACLQPDGSWHIVR